MIRAHRVAAVDQARVRCCRCDEPAVMCEHKPFKVMGGRVPRTSVAFYYFCPACWDMPGPAAPSPAARTGVSL
jgi:hypothetical protein